MTVHGEAAEPQGGAGAQAVEASAGGTARPDGAGETLAEKVIGAHAGQRVVPGQIVVADVDLAIAQDGTGPLTIQQIRELDWGALRVPQAVFFIDHAAPSPRAELSNAQRTIRDFCAETGATLSDIEMGISHQRVAESYARPGDIVIGADSHTCTAGALGAFGTGMGSTDVAVGMASGKTWLRVPETVHIEVTDPVAHGGDASWPGPFGTGVMAKDLMLAIIGSIGADGATYEALEFGGEAIGRLPVHGRLTLANMSVEAGAKAGMMASDEVTHAYLKERGREGDWRPLAPDPGADYERVLSFAARDVVPMMSAPHTVDNAHPAAELAGTPIDQVFIGTCTNGRLEDLRAAAAVLRGRRRAPHVRLIIVPSSQAVQRAAIVEGLVEVFIDAGAVFTTPGCGPCVGVHAGVPADGEVCVTTQNRNFLGRMGNPQSSIYIASPVTAAACGVAGAIVDPRELL